LKAHDHAGEKSREGDDRKRFHANRFNMMDDEINLGWTTEGQKYRRHEEREHPAHAGDLFRRITADSAQKGKHVFLA